VRPRSPRCKPSLHEERPRVQGHGCCRRLMSPCFHPSKRSRRPPERRKVIILSMGFSCKLIVIHRYLNIDYAVASTLVDDIKAGITDVVVTYDIGCQWGINLSTRLPNYTTMPPLDLDSLRSFRVAVPKFHITGHGAPCQARSNLAYMDGVGMTHGEGVETIWSHSTSLATWSRENGPAARHLILDDHWTGWNWRKYVGLRKFFQCSTARGLTNIHSGTQLKNMLERAFKWAKIQHDAADSMTEAWPNYVPKWRRMLKRYKRKQTEPNPFEQPNTGKLTCACTCNRELITHFR
jgi:hypothetical protein